MKTTKEKIEDAIEATGLLMTVTEKQDAAQAALDVVCEELISVDCIKESARRFHESQFNNNGQGKKFDDLPSHSIERYLIGQMEALKAAADKLSEK